jgi:hypothetical protein
MWPDNQPIKHLWPQLKIDVEMRRASIVDEFRTTRIVSGVEPFDDFCHFSAHDRLWNGQLENWKILGDWALATRRSDGKKACRDCYCL